MYWYSPIPLIRCAAGAGAALSEAGAGARARVAARRCALVAGHPDWALPQLLGLDELSDSDELSEPEESTTIPAIRTTIT